jgi:hypothetical protein
LVKRLHSASNGFAQEALGTSSVPDLRSTKYTAAVGNELIDLLKGYTGPPAEREVLPADVLERDACLCSHSSRRNIPPLRCLHG